MFAFPILSLLLFATCSVPSTMQGTQKNWSRYYAAGWSLSIGESPPQTHVWPSHWNRIETWQLVLWLWTVSSAPRMITIGILISHMQRTRRRQQNCVLGKTTIKGIRIKTTNEREIREVLLRFLHIFNCWWMLKNKKDNPNKGTRGTSKDWRRRRLRELVFNSSETQKKLFLSMHTIKHDLGS